MYCVLDLQYNDHSLLSIKLSETALQPPLLDHRGMGVLDELKKNWLDATK